MSTKAGTMGVSARPALFTLWTATVSALAVTAVIMSAVALNLAVREERAALPAQREVAASGSLVSGTGPGLIHVGEEAARAAALPRIYASSGVTGTGPGLAIIARNPGQPRVTGTGPGLLQVAARTQRDG
jgi:hypothetical protein